MQELMYSMSSVRLRGRLATAALALFAGSTAIAGTVAGLGVHAVASGAAAPAPAVASSAGEIGQAVSLDPGFLRTSQLPQGPRFGRWSAGRIYNGVPKTATFCLDDALPAPETRYVSYKGKKNVAAQEYVTVLDTETEARALVASLRAQIQRCYTEWLDLDIPAYKNGQRTASWKRYGTKKIEDGLTVFGVFTVPPKGFAKTTHLYGVGRDGNAVMVMHLGVIGARGDAPVKSFTKSAGKGLRQVF